jgi:predicted GNAT family acetyltransferase
MSSAYPVEHNESESRFEARVEGHLCVADYRRIGDTLHMTHTFVPPPLEGRGIAAALVGVALAHARAEGLKVVPHCSYVRRYMQRRPESQDLIAS